jgi:prephenate dehydratase
MTKENSGDADRLIAFQGELGAYSHLACTVLFPEMTPLPSRGFEDAFNAVEEGRAKLAMIPVENSLAGRVADIHHLLPASRLHIVGEFFMPVNHHLLVLPGTNLSDVVEVRSHVHALGQCRKFLRQNGLKATVGGDTAGSAAEVARTGDKSVAAIASDLAGRIYGLESLAANIEDAGHNTTRFLVMSREAKSFDPRLGPAVTSFVFHVRNVPASLYKAMGGFATNGVNMTKLESYQVNGNFTATQFYADIEGHPEQANVRLALEELSFFSREVRILGVYPAHPYRFKARLSAD